ncbi:hypothetical protein G4X40_08795 [Rhodococcus sp. D2-41]|uniref:hypothetical protein n=1 Tax=Speluncibacter jeojiensis TaxID=2710754 RepID=UPI0024103C29|nr:hypothetical protein [Rhodococcus sp. D2-41]MDG3010248.1 hypothetical protein [Rhodococcus sp. D2-41]
MSESDATEPITPISVHTRELGIAGPAGAAFGPLFLDFSPGVINVIQGPAGSGRTSLLLTLAGRFRPVSGSLDVLGRRTPASIRQVTAVAGFEGIDDLDDNVIVRDVITEQIAWETPWYKFVRRADATRFEAMCRPVFGPLPLPPLHAHLDELTELDRLLLKVSLVWSGGPAVLLVDDIEQVRAHAERSALLDRLADLALEATVIVSAIDPLAPQSPPHRYAILTETTEGEV